jgi:DsbC/DsbD-like thiol-disulfide interchange protein
MRKFRLAILFAAIVLGCAPITAAQAPAESHAKVELITEESTLTPGKSLWTGILFQLAPGWHIYWQNAGDSGEPPKIQWTLPTGFQAGPIHWPTPMRLGTGSVIDYGYEGQVLLMIPIEGPKDLAAKPIPSISADVKYIVCREICLPGKTHLTLSLPDDADSSSWRNLFDQTKAALPIPIPRSWKVSATSDRDHFMLMVRTGSPEPAATFFPLEPDQIENSATQEFASNQNGFRLALRKSDQLTKPIASVKGLLVIEGGKAYEVAVPVVSK